MYDISLRPLKGAAVTASLCGKNPTAIPAGIRISVGDKRKWFLSHLEKSLNGNTELIRFLTYLHKAGKEKGSLSLSCTCKSKYHASAVKEFLTTHYDTLDVLVPHLFPEARFTAEQALAKEQEAELSSRSGATLENHPRLTDDDRAQIKQLIENDTRSYVKLPASYVPIAVPSETIVDEVAHSYAPTPNAA